MKQYRLTGPRAGLIPRLVAGITGVIVLIGAFVIGIFAWIILAGFLMIGALALSIWVWRQRRRFEKAKRQSADSIIEAEYEIVSETREPQDIRDRR